MGIFDRIKEAIWGGPAQAAEAPAKPATPAAPAKPVAPGATPAPTPTASPAPTPATPAAPSPSAGPVDVAAVLDAAVKAKKAKLNWRTSIVDLMKALNLDSSLANRKELARELGYTGDMSKSAPMNIWLHKAVIQKLKDNGGKVPADLL